MSSPASFSVAALKTNISAAAICVAISANLNAIAWCLKISLPKAFRSCEYFKANSNAPFAIPNACEAMPILPPFNTAIAKLKPKPSSPILFSLGTFTSVNISEWVSEPRIPIFFSLIPISKPAQLFSTIKALIPLCPFSISV